MIDLKYSLVIEATQDPNFFGFYSPDLEGFSGVGNSIEDCIYKAKWGMIEHLEVMKEMSMPIPAPNPDTSITPRPGRFHEAARPVPCFPVSALPPLHQPDLLVGQAVQLVDQGVDPRMTREYTNGERRHSCMRETFVDGPSQRCSPSTSLISSSVSACIQLDRQGVDLAGRRWLPPARPGWARCRRGGGDAKTTVPPLPISPVFLPAYLCSAIQFSSFSFAPSSSTSTPSIMLLTD
jgi:predicted RNase H-like HicB family nuclease